MLYVKSNRIRVPLLLRSANRSISPFLLALTSLSGCARPRTFPVLGNQPWALTTVGWCMIPSEAAGSAPGSIPSGPNSVSGMSTSSSKAILTSAQWLVTNAQTSALSSVQPGPKVSATLRKSPVCLISQSFGIQLTQGVRRFPSPTPMPHLSVSLCLDQW